MASQSSLLQLLKLCLISSAAVSKSLILSVDGTYSIPVRAKKTTIEANAAQNKKFTPVPPGSMLRPRSRRSRKNGRLFRTVWSDVANHSTLNLGVKGGRLLSTISIHGRFFRSHRNRKRCLTFFSGGALPSRLFSSFC